MVQMLMHCDPATSQRATEFGAFELPATIGETNRIVTSHDPFVMQREDEVQVFASRRDKSGAALSRFDLEAGVELWNVAVTQKLIGLDHGGQLAQT
jgi:hypothetical protein